MRPEQIAALSQKEIAGLSTRQRRTLGTTLLRTARREMSRLRATRGAYRRTARALQRSRAWLAVAALLLGAPLAGTSFAAAPEFNAPTTNPFGMTNNGTYSSPSLVDIDGDNDLDLLIGVGDSADIGGGTDYGATIFIENIGSAAAPAFGAAQTGAFGLLEVGDFHGPAAGDLDGDGDFDMITGIRAGDLVFQRNSGTANSPSFDAAEINPFGLISLGPDAYALPAFGDIDSDDDLDLLVGEIGGNVIFFRNIGTSSIPLFAAPQTNPFGLQRVNSGSSAPTFDDVDGDGDLDAFSGDLDGNAIFFENIGSATEPAFAAQLTNRFGMEDIGGYTAPCFGDLDGDGDLDALIGEALGDLFYFERISPTRLLGACPSTAVVGCDTGFEKAQLKISEKKAGKESIQAKMQKGPAVVVGPDVLDYALCIYDDADVLVASVDINGTAGAICDGKPCWKVAGSGLMYGDKAGSEDGVSQLKLAGGAAGKAAVQLKAANNADNRLPTGVASALQTSASAKLQFTNSEDGCQEATVTVIKKQSPTEFQAQ